jgi:molybdopterin molybdotransferase
MALMSVDEALERLVSAAKAYRAARPLPHESLPLLAAQGRILANDVIAPINVPPARNSAMDGYAFRLADTVSSSPLRVSQRIPAGKAPTPLEPGTVARIFTGAVIPDGADTVEMQENCDEKEGHVTFLQPPRLGAHIRAAGEDIAQASQVLNAGTRLGPAHLGLLASLGLPEVNVVAPVKVALLCTGDELVNPGTELKPGQLYNSNATLLTALLKQQGCDVLQLPSVADTVADTEQAFRHAISVGADLVVTTGGVSVGEEDHVRTALLRLGQLALWKVAIKPGKPIALGEIDGVPVIGLPGNPQSVWVTYQVLTLPFIRCLQGDITLPVMIRVPAGFERTQPQGRREYLRVQIGVDDQGVQQLLAHPQQGSGVLSSATWAHGLALVEAGDTVKMGQLLPFYPLK